MTSAIKSRAGAAASLDQLAQTPASDIKKLGWRGMMRNIKLNGMVVVTNHNQPEAVILTVEEFEAMMKLVGQAEAKTGSALGRLRQSFDERLAVLQAADAGDRLRKLMRGPVKLGGKVKAGTSH